MATVLQKTQWINRGTVLVEWNNLANGDVGRTEDVHRFTDKTITVEGTFGAGGTIILQGTNDGTNFYTLNDPQGNALSFTSSRVEAVQENPRSVRPNVTGGDGTTSLTLRLTARGNV